MAEGQKTVFYGANNRIDWQRGGEEMLIKFAQKVLFL